MSRPRFLALRTLVGFVLAGLLVGIAPAHADTAGPLRVLLTGDSITQGFHGDYTWRSRLDKEFIRQGVDVDFVGSRRDPYVKPGFTTARYADPAFDQDHFARTGATLASHSGWIRAEVAGQQPDVVVLLAGVNDLRNGATPAQTNGYLRTWIGQARTAKPDVRMIVSPVLDARDSRRPTLSQAITQYNQLARATVSELSTDESPITMADTTRGWSLASHTSEDLHPSPTGETLIAQRIAETFRQLGVLQAPSIYRWTSWNRNPVVRVAVRNRRAVLTWDHQAIYSARVSMRRVGQAASFPATRYAGGTMTTSTLVARATYEFRVQLIRGRMATPLGPITRVFVPAAARPAAVSRVVVDAAGVRWTRSESATRYKVQFKKRKTRRWVTRQTTGLSVRAKKVVRARVWAVNGAGRSAVRVGVR